MVIGSEGRREQSLKTDQDNALIFESSTENNNYFEGFPEKYIKYLLEIGFPPCPGNVMLSNPYWRRTKEDLFREIVRWMENPKPENVLNISIFFDFRNVYGTQRIIDEMWDFIFNKIKTSKHFFPKFADRSFEI